MEAAIFGVDPDQQVSHLRPSAQRWLHVHSFGLITGHLKALWLSPPPPGAPATGDPEDSTA